MNDDVYPISYILNMLVILTLVRYIFDKIIKVEAILYSWYSFHDLFLP